MQIKSNRDRFREDHLSLHRPGNAFASRHTQEVLPLTTPALHSQSAFVTEWGWMRLIDTSDTTHPFITGQFLIDQNQLSFCGSAGDTPVTEQFRSFSTHNPTVLQDLAFIDWHSNGVQAIDISNPTNPAQAGVCSGPGPIDACSIRPALRVGES